MNLKSLSEWCNLLWRPSPWCCRSIRRDHWLEILHGHSTSPCISRDMDNERFQVQRSSANTAATDVRPISTCLKARQWRFLRGRSWNGSFFYGFDHGFRTVVWGTSWYGLSCASRPHPPICLWLKDSVQGFESPEEGSGPDLSDPPKSSLACTIERPVFSIVFCRGSSRELLY